MIETTGRLAKPLDADIERMLKYKTSYWDWCVDCVKTLDQADKVTPVKAFPADKEVYLRWTLDRVYAEPLLAVVKHRRMFITWGCLSIFTHDACFNIGRFLAVISKKEEESDVLVRKCKFIIDNIPENKMPFKPKIEYSYCKLRFPETDSLIQGFASGDDQLRQHTCSRILADEFAFWPRARASFVSMKPTLEGGGQIALVSTRFPGFFKEVIDDTMDFT